MQKRDVVTSFISIILIIMGALGLIEGLLISTGLIQLGPQFSELLTYSKYLTSSNTGFGIILMIASIIEIALGYGIWKLKSWAFYLGVIWTVFYLVTIFFAVSNLVIIVRTIVWLFILIWLIHKRNLFIKK